METSTRAGGVAAPAEHYDARYYGHHCGGTPYERNDHWLGFFGKVADGIVADLAPRTVMDAGCAMGFLVESLRDRGVDARGIDISEFAISRVREDVREFCTVGSILDQLPGRYDLVVCLEVLEHLDLDDSERAIDVLCAATDDIIFSSSPTDFREETHVNVQPPEHWVEAFAKRGFIRDVLHDPRYIAPWAIHLRRREEPLPRLLLDYERALWHAKHESWQRYEEIADRAREIDRLQQRVAAAEAQAAHHEHRAREIPVLQEQLSAAHGALVEAKQKLDVAYAELDAIHASGAYHAAVSAQQGARRLAPPGTLRAKALRRTARAGFVVAREGPVMAARRAVARARGHVAPPAEVVQATGIEEQYRHWREANEPGHLRLAEMRSENLRFAHRPVFSVVVPVYNPELGWLERAAGSVLNQNYDRWELCLCNDGSTRPGVREWLDDLAEREPRARVVHREQNGGIAAASADAMALATGDFVVLLDHDDTLRPHALHSLAAYLQEHPDADVLYSDEDKVLLDGGIGAPTFKPDYDPDLLLSCNYMCHVAAVRRSVAEDAGGFRPGYDGAQDHDLLLRAVERARHVGHIPDVLYAWHQVEGSAALAHGEKPAASEAGRRAVEDALRRRGLDARAEATASPGIYHVRYAIAGEPEVSVVIPTRDRVDLLRRCIESLRERTTWRRYSIVVVDNDSREDATHAFFAANPDITVVPAPGGFNYSRIVNAGVRASSGEHVVTLNNDIVVLTPDWIECMLEHSAREGVGAVGCRLLYPDGAVQHEGITAGGFHFAENLRPDYWWSTIRERLAVTGACMMFPRRAFDEVDGFDEALGVAFNDVDFCLRLGERGYRIVCTPLAQLEHVESGSRSSLHPVADEETFTRRYGRYFVDPFLGPHVERVQPLTIRLHGPGSWQE